MTIRDNTILLNQHSHIVATFIRISEPTVISQGKWADAQIQQAFEETASGQVVPLMMLSAMLLYPGCNYAHGCHLAQLERAIGIIDAGLNDLRGQYPADFNNIDAMAPKGSVAIDIRTMVPKTQSAKVKYGIQIHVNDGKENVDIAVAVRRTNPAMVLQLGLAVKDIFAKASPASAMKGPTAGAPTIVLPPA